MMETDEDHPTESMVSSLLERTLRLRQRQTGAAGEATDGGRVAKVINDALRAAGLMR
jgi:hypothetical protein